MSQRGIWMNQVTSQASRHLPGKKKKKHGKAVGERDDWRVPKEMVCFIESLWEFEVALFLGGVALGGVP